MEPSGGEIAAKRAKSPSGDGAAGEDRLSALPDDVLILILLRLRTDEAARTSVLSSRWRRVWALLPELRFSFAPEAHRLRDALAAGTVPLRCLFVADKDSSAESLAVWLPAAARRVSGDLTLINIGTLGMRDEAKEEEARKRGPCPFDLPCFAKATSILLDLGDIGLSVPPAGVFARLTDLTLKSVQFHGPCTLGEAVSSPRCPCLKRLDVRDTDGLQYLAIRSESLLTIDLRILRGLQKLAVVAPLLTELTLLYCFGYHDNEPVADVSVPQLKVLKWMDEYDPSSVHLGMMEYVQLLGTFFIAYGPREFAYNRSCLMLLSRFKVIECLTLTLCYPTIRDDYEYLMEDMTLLPGIKSLHLILIAKGHAIGPCVFHVLRLCSGIQRLGLELSTHFMEARTACSPGCICDQPSDWKTEELLLNRLHEVEIQRFRGSEHELALVKQLLNWATTLKRMSITFDCLVKESMAKELCQILQSISKPEICMELYMYGSMFKVSCAPED